MSPATRHPVHGTALLPLLGALWLGAFPARAAQPLRIMPLGDSLTRGSMGHPRYHPGGYRTRLYRRLTRERRPVDFVGSQRTNPDPEGLPDPDHEGHKGFRIDQVRARVKGWLDAARPDVVLLLIGANDVNQGFRLAAAPQRLEQLVAAIADHPCAPCVIVAQIPGSTHHTNNARIARYNRAIPPIVKRQRAAGRHVSTVDLYRVVRNPGDFANFLHPNASGYGRIADAWLGAIGALRLPRASAEE